MGYESGGSLGDRLRSGALPWPEVLDIGIRMADALEVAHRAGVLHRDVKPDNILIGAFGDPKLTDFGIARVTGGPHTSSGRVTASVVHAPPEVLSGNSPDVRADVYSLCSTMYTLIAGRTPFERASDESLLPLIARIVSDPPPPLPGVPDDLAALLHHGLAKRAQDRPPSATALGVALRQIAAAHGLHVPPPRIGGEVMEVSDDDDTVVVASRAPGSPPAVVPTAAHAPAAAAGPTVATGRSRPLRPGPRRSGLVAAVAVVAVTAVGAAVGVWALLRSDEPTPPQDVVVSDPQPPTPSATPAAPGGDPPMTPTPTAPQEGAGQDPAGLAPEDLASVLLGTPDLPGGAARLDSVRATDTADPDHPVRDLGYCDAPPPLRGVGSAAVDVYRLPSGLTDVALSYATVTESDARAVAIRDEVVANARTCDRFTSSGSTIERGAVTDLGQGVVRLDLEIVVLGQRFPTAIYLGTAGPLLLGAELPASVDRATGEALAITLLQRAQQLVEGQ